MDDGSREVRMRAWRIGLVWIALTLGALGFAGWRFWIVTEPAPLQTDLLALLPRSAADPAVDQAVDRLTDAVGQRVVFLVEADDPTQARTAAQIFADTLARGAAGAKGEDRTNADRAAPPPLFSSVIAKLPPFDLSRIGATYLPFRFALLTTDDRAALQRLDGAAPDARDATLRQWLDTRLYAPDAAAGGGPLQASLADDPFAWLSHWLSALPLTQTRLQFDQGYLVAHVDGDGGHDKKGRIGVLVLATLAGSPYATQTQQSVIDAVAVGDAAMRQTPVPGLTLTRFGAVFYAEAARASAQHEVHVIGLASLAGIACLMLWVFRSPRLLLLGFLSTAVGVLFAIDITLAVFGQLHLLTLVFGASLIGEAVDYAIQYFVAYLEQGAAATVPRVQSSVPLPSPARRAARVVRPALTVALATSLLGYAVLAAVPFPALRQIACFAFAGIATAFLCVLTLLPVLLPRLKPQAAASRTVFFARAGRGLATAYRLLQARRVWPVVLVLLLAAAPGWRLLHSDDDIHLLVQRNAVLLQQENRIRSALGSDESTQFFLVRGRDDESVLQGIARIDARLHASALLPAWQSVTPFVPPMAQQRADAALLDRVVFADPTALRRILADAGLRDDVIDAWLAAHAQAKADGAVLSLSDWMSAPWTQPYRHLWLGTLHGTPGGQAMQAAVMPLQGVSDDKVDALRVLAEQVGTADARIVFVDKARSVSELFGAYRVRGGFWLLGVSALILGLLSCRYGLRGAARVLLPTVLSVGSVLGAFGYLHQPLTLFNILALMLVFGVGVNYAVFLREGCLRLVRDGSARPGNVNANASANVDPHASVEAADRALGAVWVGVLLSAATTFLSFGLLACSAMPALRSFGLTLSIGIGVAVLLSPLGMPFDPGRRARKERGLVRDHHRAQDV